MSEKVILGQSDAERIVNGSEEISDDVQQKLDLIAQYERAVRWVENRDDDTPEALTDHE
jgi:hypothetical protein